MRKDATFFPFLNLKQHKGGNYIKEQKGYKKTPISMIHHCIEEINNNVFIFILIWIWISIFTLFI